MFKKKYFTAIILSACITISLYGCGSAEKTEPDTETVVATMSVEEEKPDTTMSTSETEAVAANSTENLIEKAEEATKEEQEVIEKLLPQITDMYVLLNSSKVDLAASLEDGTGIIKEIRVVESDLKSNKAGVYSVTYCVTVYTAGLEKAMEKTKDIEKYVPAKDEKTKDILIMEKVSVIKESKAKEVAKNSGTATVVTDKGESYTQEEKSGTNEPSDKTGSNTDASVKDTGTVTSQGQNQDAGQTSPPSSSQDSGLSAGQSEEKEETHTHTWVAQTETVHHDAVTSQQWVEDTAAYDEPVYEEQPVYETVSAVRCNGCGEEFSQYSEWCEHSNYFDDIGDYSHGSYSVVYHQVQTGTQTVQTGTIHHDATGHYETIEVQTAYDETVTTGYRCSGCGATK